MTPKKYLTIREIAEDLYGPLSDPWYEDCNYRQAWLIVRQEIPHRRVSAKDTRVDPSDYKRWKKRAFRKVLPKRG